MQLSLTSTGARVAICDRKKTAVTEIVIGLIDMDPLPPATAPKLAG